MHSAFGFVSPASVTAWNPAVVAGFRKQMLALLVSGELLIELVMRIGVHVGLAKLFARKSVGLTRRAADGRRKQQSGCLETQEVPVLLIESKDSSMKPCPKPARCS